MTDAAWASFATMTAVVVMAAVVALVVWYLDRHTQREDQHRIALLDRFLARNFTEYVSGQMVGQTLEVEQEEDANDGRARVAQWLKDLPDMEAEIEHAEATRRG